jgi:phosphopantetheinyl transferase
MLVLDVTQRPMHALLPRSLTSLHFRPAQPLWQSTSTVPARAITCPENMVHVWGFELDAATEALAYWYRLLSAEEQQRAGRFIHHEHKRRWVAAHGLKREVLSAYLQTAPQELKFVIQANGKPALKQPVHEKWHFSLSHSRNRLLLALSSYSSVGVDIEYEDAPRPFLALAQRFFHPDEVEAMRAVTEVKARRQFYRAWVAKEAILKAEGARGLATYMAQWPVPCAELDQIELKPWTVHWLPLLELGFCAALAIEPENRWRWI